MTDWATDFDHLDPGFVEDPHAVYSRLRDECPVAHTDRYHGVWIPTRYEDLAAIAHDHQRFSSRTILVTDRAESPTDLGFHAPPITEDPPYHTD
ncbi:MAG: cytochrome P450, partial [Sorangiineae bacterium PRO1]|nr:cytochrome P450 [Sorangiineae bacterium PRO1]